MFVTVNVGFYYVFKLVNVNIKKKYIFSYIYSVVIFSKFTSLFFFLLFEFPSLQYLVIMPTVTKMRPSYVKYKKVIVIGFITGWQFIINNVDHSRAKKNQSS